MGFSFLFHFYFISLNQMQSYSEVNSQAQLMHECHQKCQVKNTEICCKRIVTDVHGNKKNKHQKNLLHDICF